MHIPFDQLPLLYWIVILAALAFDFANGWHDTANAVATCISTRILRPATAIALSAVLNFAGALLSTKVAKTIGGGIVNPTIVTGEHGAFLIFAAMLAAIIWEVYTVLEGLPVSGSHALIGGLIGAAISVYGFNVIVLKGILKIFLAMVLSPVLGVIIGMLILKLSYTIAQRLKPIRVKKIFAFVQIITSSTMSLMHGQNDAQKVMGVITLLLFTGGYFGAVEFKNVHVPIWVMLACAFSMAMGTAIGGRKVIKTLGCKLAHLRPIEGASAELSASIVLEAASSLGVPVSTTHTITGSIVGVGVEKRMKAVKWGTGLKIIYAWIFTLPVVALMSGILAKIFLYMYK
ncbi:MAG: inorganic phosphate transporter [Elusimicrobia bacterium]|nr:inorganic phosphate transporter [Candidatus Liberimonas magnetica]